MEKRKSKVLILTESQMISLVERIINEEIYDSQKLYNRDYVVNRLKNGPRELKKIIKELPYIDCKTDKGEMHVCTKIPEVVYVYLKNRY